MTSGKLIRGSVEPPHRCRPHRIWDDLGGKSDMFGAPFAAEDVVIECECGTQFTPNKTISGWVKVTDYTDQLDTPRFEVIGESERDDADPALVAIRDFIREKFRRVIP